MKLRSPRAVVSLLAVLTSVGPISTDMYLPAFPAMRAALQGDEGAAQMTLAAWFLGLACGQITHGPLSDRLGRRRPLLAGTLLYGAASAGCALAPDMMVLCLCRAVAAFGGAASMVVPRAMIRDMVRDDIQAARMVSWLALVMGVVPVLAPTLGSLVSDTLGWRAIFWIAAVYGFCCTVLIWRLLPDTLPRGRRVRLHFISVLVRYNRILRERVFLSHALAGGFGTFSLFAFLGGAPPVFLGTFHVAPMHFGLDFVVNAGAYILGTQGNARLIRHIPAGILLRRGVLGLLASALLMLACAMTGFSQVWGVVVPMGLAMGALGFVLPGAAIGAVMPHAADAGSASALYGTLVFLIGALGTMAVGMIHDGGAVPMALLMVAGALCAGMALLARFAGRRPQPPAMLLPRHGPPAA